MNALKDTLRLGPSVEPGAPADLPASAVPELTPHLLRIVRRALRPGGGATPLDRAIRSAVAAAEPAGGTTGGDDARARLVAARLSALLGPRLAGGATPHQETVRN
jgi:hypothetical protein